MTVNVAGLIVAVFGACFLFVVRWLAAYGVHRPDVFERVALFEQFSNSRAFLGHCLSYSL